LAEVLQDAPGLVGVEAADGDAGVDDDVIPRPDVGHAGGADAAAQAGELDQRGRKAVRGALEFNHLARNAQTHGLLPHFYAPALRAWARGRCPARPASRAARKPLGRVTQPEQGPRRAPGRSASRAGQPWISPRQFRY